MNKYYVEIPYSCTTYGRVKGYIYAETQTDAEERADDVDNIEDSEYVDHDTDNTEHYYSDMELSLQEENVPEDDIPEYIRESQTPVKVLIPDYFLSEINLI
jgi:hypothetical protein